jgi:hypothetical protein
VRQPATFILTAPDGTTRPALPPPTPASSGASPAAVSAEDAAILGLVAVRP